MHSGVKLPYDSPAGELHPPLAEAGADGLENPPSEPPALEFKTLGSRLVLTPIEGGVEFMVKQPFDELGTTQWINPQEARQLATWLLTEFPAAE